MLFLLFLFGVPYSSKSTVDFILSTSRTKSLIIVQFEKPVLLGSGMTETNHDNNPVGAQLGIHPMSRYSNQHKLNASIKSHLHSLLTYKYTITISDSQKTMELQILGNIEDVLF